jgi:microcystin-dependent protein
MTNPFVAEIRMFGFNFAPLGWAQCNGQLLPLSQNTALFSLLGTFYGGDGKSTFALPNLEGSVATNQGQGTSGQQWFLGEQQGSETVVLLQSEMPSHNHFFMTTSANGTNQTAANAQLAKGFKGNLQSSNTAKMYSATASPNPVTQMNPLALSITGSGLPHNNMMPFLTVNFCIAMQGVFPPRN